jgi:hypothetical protein
MKPLGMLILVVLLVAGLWYWLHRSADSSLTNGEVHMTGSDEAVKGDPNTNSAGQTSPQAVSETPVGANGAPLQIMGQTPAAGQSATGAPPNYMTPPAADTIERNPPNGMVFAGTGRYQVYRQGDLTWRLNTENGQACIIFATDSEWRKARVYRNGCNGKG